MNIEEYLKSNCERQVIDHALRAEIGKDGNPRFYIHPAGVSGETLDFVVTKNQLHPVYVWDGMQELADANPMTPELRAKLDAARAAAESKIANNPQADHWQKAYNQMAEATAILMAAAYEIQDKADPYTHQIHWCRQTASKAIAKANKSLHP